MSVYAKITVNDVLIYSTMYVWPIEKRKRTQKQKQKQYRSLRKGMSGSQRERITKLGGIPAFTHSFIAMASLYFILYLSVANQHVYRNRI